METNKKAPIKVKVIEEYRGNINPERKYHFVDIETGKEPVGNMRKEDIQRMANYFKLTIVDQEGGEIR